MTERPIAVEITIHGRAGPSVRAAVDMLDAAVVPRHTAVVGIRDIPELLSLLVALDARGMAVARVSRPGAPRLSGAGSPPDDPGG